MDTTAACVGNAALFSSGVYDATSIYGMGMTWQQTRPRPFPHTAAWFGCYTAGALSYQFLPQCTTSRVAKQGNLLFLMPNNGNESDRCRWFANIDVGFAKYSKF